VAWERATPALIGPDAAFGPRTQGFSPRAGYLLYRLSCGTEQDAVALTTFPARSVTFAAMV
jgi:hypothetical protein